MEMSLHEDKKIKKRYISEFFMGCEDDDDDIGTFTYLNCTKCSKRTLYGVRLESLILFTCKRCKYHYMMCEKCHDSENITPKKVLPFLKVDIDNGDRGRVIWQTKGKSFCFKDFKDDENYKFVEDKENYYNYIECLTPIYYFDEHKLGPLTGPDGGQVSVWHCDFCDEDLECTDK
jgi:hypothetical protein